MRLHQIRSLREANVVNPRDIDDWIENRISRVRRHYPETRKTLFPWLAKRVRQYVVGLTDQQAARMMQTVPDPSQSLETLAGQYGYWVLAAAQRGETLFHFDWTLTSLMTPLQNAVTHVIDYIISLDAVATQPQEHEASLQAEAARQLTKITRLTLEQAVTHADRWFEDLQAASREHAERTEATGTKAVMAFADGFRWVQITDTRSLDREGDIMQHCVGGGSYDKDLKKDRCRIYSLRDPQNQPHVTIETRLWWEWDDGEESFGDDGTWVIEQVKGKQNKPPVSKYLPYLKAFLNQIKLEPSETGAGDLDAARLYKHESEPRYGSMPEVGQPVVSVGDITVFDHPPSSTLFILRDDTAGLGTGA